MKHGVDCGELRGDELDQGFLKVATGDLKDVLGAFNALYSIRDICGEGVDDVLLNFIDKSLLSTLKTEGFYQS